jgi:hypothetical protein
MIDSDIVRRAPKVLLHDHLDGGLRPATVIELARDAVFHLQYENGQEWAARATAASREIGDPLLMAAALGFEARALAWGGDASNGEARRIEAAALIDVLPDEDLARRLDLPLTRIGTIREGSELSILDASGQAVVPPSRGWQHF